MLLMETLVESLPPDASTAFIVAVPSLEEDVRVTIASPLGFVVAVRVETPEIVLLLSVPRVVVKFTMFPTTGSEPSLVTFAVNVELADPSARISSGFAVRMM